MPNLSTEELHAIIEDMEKENKELEKTLIQKNELLKEKDSLIYHLKSVLRAML